MRASGWVLTCDPGVDDAVALAVAAGRDDCRMEAVVAGAGNVPAGTAWRNAAGIAALVGLALPVGIGSACATDGATIHRPGGRHGDDGLAGLSGRLPAVDGPPPDGLPSVQGNVLATGPLTDCALALRAGQRIERVVWMGGSAEVGPSRSDAGGSDGGSDVAEFNAAADPGAVDVVLGGPAHVDVVPIEITRQVTLRSDDLARWSAGTAVSRFCADVVTARGATGTTARSMTTGTTGMTAFVVHDAVAVIAALEPGLFDWSPRRLAASASGRLASLPGSENARLAVDVDAAAVRTRIVAAVAAVTS